MNQPGYWSTLAAAVVVMAAIRWRVGRALLARRAMVPRRWEWAAATTAVVVLVFHCAAMFFAGWVDAVPGLHAPAAAVRALNGTSQWAYCVPAAVLLASLRRAWWPATILIAITLAGVGVTMFWPYPLATHLSWLASAVIAGGAAVVALISGPTRAPSAVSPHTI